RIIEEYRSRGFEGYDNPAEPAAMLSAFAKVPWHATAARSTVQFTEAEARWLQTDAADMASIYRSEGFEWAGLASSYRALARQITKALASAPSTWRTNSDG